MTTQKCRLYVIYRHVWNMNCNVTSCLLANPKLSMVCSLSQNRKHCAAWVAIVVGVADKFDRQWVLLTTQSTCRSEIFLSSLCDKVSGGSTWRYPNFFKYSVWYVWEPRCQNPTWFVPSFSTHNQLVTDGQTDRGTHDNSIHHTSIVSHGKNELEWVNTRLANEKWLWSTVLDCSPVYAA